MNKWYIQTNIKTDTTTIFFGPNFWLSMPRQFKDELQEICNAHNRELVQVGSIVHQPPCLDPKTNSPGDLPPNIVQGITPDTKQD